MNRSIWLVIGLLFFSPFTLANDDIAQELNQLYQKTSCEGDDISCKGVLIHGQHLEGRFWYPSIHRDVVSFSYLRADISPKAGNVVWSKIGYIVEPTQEAKLKQHYTYQPLCAFVENGATVGRDHNGCGNGKQQALTPSPYSGCSALNIHTPELFFETYVEYFDYPEYHKTIAVLGGRDGTCSFSVAPNEFSFFEETSRQLQQKPELVCLAMALEGVDDPSCWTHNEVLLTAWRPDSTAPQEVPIKAIYIVDDGHSLVPSKLEFEAIRAADAYEHATLNQRKLPIVILHLDKVKAGAKEIFTEMKTY